MNKTRLVEILLEFECNASIFADALNIGTEEVLFLPHNDHLMITNVGGTYTAFKVMTKECFLSYKLKPKIKEEWYEKQLIEKMPPVMISVDSFVKLLRKIQGRVKITMEMPTEGEVRYIHVKDMIGKKETFSGKFKIKEREVHPMRILARFVEYFDDENLMLPKVSLQGGECHILKIKEGLTFSPMIMPSKGYKQFITSVACLTPDEFDVQVFNASIENEFTAHYTYDFLQSTNESKLQKYKDHKTTYFSFPANPQTLELVLKYQSAQPDYITIIEIDDEIAPFYVFFSSLNDMGDAGKIYTSALLFLEGEIDEKDVTIHREQEDE